MEIFLFIGYDVMYVCMLLACRGVIIKDAHMGATLMRKTYNAVTNSGSFSVQSDEHLGYSQSHSHLKNHRVSGKINDIGKR